MEDQQNDKEFMLIVNSDVWRVYARDQNNAKKRFLTMCSKHSKTDNEEYQKYWTKMHNDVLDGKYTLIQNEDFEGVRKVVG